MTSSQSLPVEKFLDHSKSSTAAASVGSSMSSNVAKRVAASKAVEVFVKGRSNLRVGLGSGSTVVHVATALKQAIAAEPSSIVSCVPTSYQSRQLILNNQLPLRTLEENENSSLHLTIDGADEVTKCPNGGFVAIKGGGGCMLQEKIIASAAQQLVLVIRSDKVASYLGQTWTKGVPIEVLPMAHSLVSRKITTTLGGECILRMASAKMGPIVTDNGNFILDWKFPLLRNSSSSNSQSESSNPISQSESSNPKNQSESSNPNSQSESNKPNSQSNSSEMNNQSKLTNGVKDEETSACNERSCSDWKDIDTFLHSIPGLIETGLFVNMADAVVSADDDGSCEVTYT